MAETDVTSLVVDKDVVSMEKNANETLTLKLLINNEEYEIPENFDVIWSSSNENVATVQDGIITSINPGK